MNRYYQLRAAQILKCKIEELPDNPKEIKAALRHKKAKEIAERELVKGMKHG